MSRGYREITLTQGRRALVDEEDFSRVSAHRWYAIRSGNRFYAATHVKTAVLPMHRFIIGLGLDRNGVDVHHKNGDGLDNRRENLVAMSRSEHRKQHLYMARHPGPCPFCDNDEVWYEPTHDDGAVWLMCPACGRNWKGDECD